jgi:hypothetical protein
MLVKTPNLHRPEANTTIHSPNGPTPQFVTTTYPDPARNGSVDTGTLRERRVTPPSWVQMAGVRGDDDARSSMEDSSTSRSVARERSTSRDGKPERGLRAFRTRSRETDPERGVRRLSAEDVPRSISRTSVHSVPLPTMSEKPANGHNDGAGSLK